MECDAQLLRTGAIGNRDAETLINTLVEPKRTILGNLRRELLSLGYSEEAGYDAINIESYVSYSYSGITRFFLKHKWELLVVVVFQKAEEKKECSVKFPFLVEKENEVSSDGMISQSFSPPNDTEPILELAKYFVSNVPTK